jgi:tetratricopeptide (TPR) repeat protein
MKCTRKQIALVISGVVGLGLLGYGIVRIFPRITDPYAGLVTTMDVQMDDATRNLVRQRLATAKASIEASIKAGEKVDMGLYQAIAEQYLLLGDLASSREAYEVYLEKNPISYTGWNAYGDVLEYMKDYDHAGIAYRKALEYAQTEELYRDYAELLQRYFPEKKTEYKAVLDDAFAHIGQTLWTMTALGDWYFAEGDCALGRDHYDVAHTLAPDNTAIVEDAKTRERECEEE